MHFSQSKRHNEVSRQKQEDWSPCFLHKAKHSNRARQVECEHRARQVESGVVVVSGVGVGNGVGVGSGVGWGRERGQCKPCTVAIVFRHRHTPRQPQPPPPPPPFPPPPLQSLSPCLQECAHTSTLSWIHGDRPPTSHPPTSLRPTVPRPSLPTRPQPGAGHYRCVCVNV